MIHLSSNKTYNTRGGHLAYFVHKGRIKSIRGYYMRHEPENKPSCVIFHTLDGHVLDIKRESEFDIISECHDKIMQSILKERMEKQ